MLLRTVGIARAERTRASGQKGTHRRMSSYSPVKSQKNQVLCCSLHAKDEVASLSKFDRELNNQLIISDHPMWVGAITGKMGENQPNGFVRLFTKHPSFWTQTQRTKTTKRSRSNSNSLKLRILILMNYPAKSLLSSISFWKIENLNTM